MASGTRSRSNSQNEPQPVAQTAPVAGGNKARRKVEKNDGDENAVPIELIGEQLLPEDAFSSWVIDELVKMGFHTIYNASNGNKLSDIVMYFMHNAFEKFDMYEHEHADRLQEYPLRDRRGKLYAELEYIPYPSHVLIETEHLYDVWNAYMETKSMSGPFKMKESVLRTQQKALKDAIVDAMQADENVEGDKEEFIKESLTALKRYNENLEAEKRLEKLEEAENHGHIDDSRRKLDFSVAQSGPTKPEWASVMDEEYPKNLLFLVSTTKMSKFRKLFDDNEAYKKMKQYNTYVIAPVLQNSQANVAFQERVNKILLIMDESDFKNKLKEAYQKQYMDIGKEDFKSNGIFVTTPPLVICSNLWKVICPFKDKTKKMKLRDANYTFLQYVLNSIQIDLYTIYMNELTLPSANKQNDLSNRGQFTYDKITPTNQLKIAHAYKERERITQFNLSWDQSTTSN